MKISESWLREWSNPALNTQEIANQLTMLGLEVDAISKAALDFTGVIVAHVISTCKHPEADRLTLCTVDDGQNQIQVVCGASNVRPNLKVALATCGASLPDGLKIKKSKLRGQESHGMLCSVAELGLDDKSYGILELPEDAPLGMDLREYLQLDDNIYDIDLTPNRADCLSVMGVARELAVKNNLALTKPDIIKIENKINAKLAVFVKEPEVCPKYVGRVIKGLRTSVETPIWMREKLRRSGLRAVHPVVDILNFVMLEFGQPMHAFDLQKIKGSMQVRYARPAEKLMLLNLQEINLEKDCLVIADDEKALALAGIMGGNNSAITQQTVDIFLESAFFTPAVIANKARKFSLTSDAAQRFERGVDSQLADVAIERATQLIQQIAGGEAGPLVSCVNKQFLPGNVTINFSPTKVSKLIGVNIESSAMQNILERLGMKVENTENHWLVTPPSYRFDLSLDVDLIEEIARVYGFDAVKPTLPKVEIKSGSICTNELLLENISAFFANRGYQETISYSFVDPEIQELIYPKSNQKKLINPISPELAAMRVGMWPGLIASMIHNIYRQQQGMKLIEAGTVFKPDLQNSGTAVREESVIAGLITGSYGDLNWSEHSGKYDFYDIKGDLEALFAKFSFPDVIFEKAAHAALHPGKSAAIKIKQQQVGFVGALHPNLTDTFALSNEVLVFELSLKSLLNLKPIIFHPVSKYPQTRRDLSLLVDASITAAELKNSTLAAIADVYLIKEFAIFDVYTGHGVPTGKKSIAISLLLQDDNATLVDAKINSIMDAIVNKLIADHKVFLR